MKVKTMKINLMLAALCLTACSTSQPPAKLEQIHMSAKSRITYDNYAKKDWRYIPENEKGSGNCAVFAFTTFIDAANAGMNPEIKLCRLPDGTGHAFTRAQGWDSDVRFKRLIPSNQQDCQ